MQAMAGPDPIDAPLAGAGPSPRQVFRSRHRLSGSEAFSAVYRRGLRKRAGPLTVIGLPNDAGEHRLGLSVGRRVGGAVQRVAVKRRLREAFRLSRTGLHQLAGRVEGQQRGFDWVIAVHPHTPMNARAYQELFEMLAQRVLRAWNKRDRREQAGASTDEPGEKSHDGQG